MGEEVKMAEYDGDAEDRVLDWESGLPSADDLTPLSQALIPPELASAFSISPVTLRTAVEVNQASRDTLSNLRGYKPPESHHDEDDDEGGSESRKARRIEAAAEEEEVACSGGIEEAAARTVKRPRLVWTPQLHKRFVEVVGHLGIKSAVPKTIMQLMNVEGLTRENVASHLQKYRLYLKRMHGLSSDSPSSDSSDSPPNADGLHHHFPMPYPPVPVPVPMPLPMPVMGMGPPPPPPPPPGYHHHHHHHHHHQQFNMYQQQRDWSSAAANNYASVAAYPHSAPADN